MKRYSYQHQNQNPSSLRERGLTNFLIITLLLQMTNVSSTSMRTYSAFVGVVPRQTNTNRLLDVKKQWQYQIPNKHERTASSSSSSMARLNSKKEMNNNDQDTDKEIDFQRYNDDAFGLVFLVGGFASQDINFSGTFLVLSAIAAIATSNGGLFKFDSRIPGVVAMMTLLVSPIVSSIRLTAGSSGGAGAGAGSIFDNIQAPIPVEIGLCCFSLVVGFYQWKKGSES